MKFTEFTSDSTASDQSVTDDQMLEAVCDCFEHLTERVAELETLVAQKDGRITELAAYKNFTGAEFAAVRGRITDVEEQA